MLVIVCSVMVVLFDDFGLYIFIIWLCGRLLMFRVMFSVMDLVGMIEIG